MTEPIPDVDGEGAPEDAERSATLRAGVTLLGQYLFWLVVLSSVVIGTWWSSSGSAAFRYAGF